MKNIVYVALLLSILVLYQSDLSDNHEIIEENISNKSGNFKERMLKTDKFVYFPGEVVVVESNFKPNISYIITPIGVKKINFESKGNKTYVFEFPLKKKIVLGEYIVVADGMKKKFYVDSYSIDIKIFDERIVGKIKFYVIPPESVEYKLLPDNISGAIRISGDEFILESTEKTEKILIRIYNKTWEFVVSKEIEKKKRKKEVEIRDVYFPGESIRIVLNFKPKKIFILDPIGNIYKPEIVKKGDKYVVNFNLSKNIVLGEYVLFVDNVKKEFYVDFYEIEANLQRNVILGTVKYYFKEPDEIYYEINGKRGYVDVEDGAFVIPLEFKSEKYSVVLKCGNAVFRKTFVVPEVRKIVAYDPVDNLLIIKIDTGDMAYIKKFVDKISKKIKKEKYNITIKKKGEYSFVEISIPANRDILREFNFSEKVVNTTVDVVRIGEDKIRVILSNKLDVWYRIKVDIPAGYRVKEIVRADGKKIVNNITINRITGEVSGGVMWYVQNNTLYFYDDPIWGYDITLIPPAPNNSIAIELAYDGLYAGAGQISAIVFPYSQGDNATTIAQNDHAGRTEDNWANEIDINAGSKIAIRFVSNGVTLQYGNPYYYCNFFTCIPTYTTLGADGDITELARVDVPLNTVPDGTLESVIITEMSTAGGEVNITQKVIIRDNYRWFATIYYIKPNINLTSLRFFQGMDWNFAGSYTGDNAYYNSTHDIVYGYDSNAPAGSIQYGGYGSDLSSSAHDVGYYTDIYYFGFLVTEGMWGNIYRDSLNNATNYTGDAATALAWDLPALNVGSTWVVPIIWGLGFNFTDMVNQINMGRANLYDVGILSIDSPENGTTFNPNVDEVVVFNATVALYGLVDQENVQVIFNITKLDGGFSDEISVYVNLSVPFNETAQISIPYNISALPYGTYNVSFRTNLSKDQNRSNDLKWIIIKLVSFTVGPDQEKVGNSGDELFYNVTSQNYFQADRFDINVTESTKGWTTRIYNGSEVVAEDLNGDGTWDYIAEGYDVNLNGLPDIFLPYGETNITVSKIIPATATLGEVDITVLEFINTRSADVRDSVKLTTRTPLPPTKQKTFYLHGDLKLNTTIQQGLNNYTAVPPNSISSWYQTPPFADDFTISGKIMVYLWMNSSAPFSQHTVTVSLIYTDGTISSVLGSNTTTVILGSAPELQVFEITLDSQKTVPKNSYIILRLENSQTTETLYVFHDSNYISNITLNTTTYVSISDVFFNKDSYLPGEYATVFVNVTDPIGAYDILGANITIYYPNNTLYISDVMMLNGTDTSSLPLWKLFNYTFYLPVEGMYRIKIYGIESNGVFSVLDYKLPVFFKISGRIFEDFGTLGVPYNDSEDKSLKFVKLTLFRDDGDGTFNQLRDLPVATTTTDLYGNYTFFGGKGIYFVAVDSKTIESSLRYNSGYTGDSSWAEQTFVVTWNGTEYVGVPKFGGKNPEMSDNCSIIFYDDFETFENWQNYSLGIVEQFCDLSFYGECSLRKTGFNDPNGGYRILDRNITRGIIIEGYTYRPDPWDGGSIDRVGIEDSGFNGYSFRVHHAQNYIAIDIRNGGTATLISQTVPWDPPENEWYFWRFILYSNGTITFSTYYKNGSLGATVSTTDLNYTTFDRIVVHGGYDYYLDNIFIRPLYTNCEHFSKVNTTSYNGESIDFGFSFEVIVNTRDGDDDPLSNRSIQGSLRQFIQNSNSIAGVQKSIFRIPMSDSGYTVEFLNATKLDVWKIKLSSRLPEILDNVILNASTQNGSYATISGFEVGVYSYKVPDFTTPRVEVYGYSDIFTIKGSHAVIQGFSIYTLNISSSAIKIIGNNSFGEIIDNFIGVLANGSNATLGYVGISVGDYLNEGYYENLSAKIKHNIIAYFGFYGIFVDNTTSNTRVEECWIHNNGGLESYGGGILLTSNGNAVKYNYIERNKNNGTTTSLYGGAGIEVYVDKSSDLSPNLILNNTIELNERWGILVSGLYGRANIENNIISENRVGVLIGDEAVANITKNSIYNNTEIGIDINVAGDPNGDGVTPNDGAVDPFQPNYGIDFPIITKAYTNGSVLYVEGYIGNESVGASSNFSGAVVEVFVVRADSIGDNLEGNYYNGRYYGEGYEYIGSLFADYQGFFRGYLYRQIEKGTLITATATINGTSEFGPNIKVMLYRNISASIKIFNMSITIEVSAGGSTNYNVSVYWKKPKNITVVSMSGDYDYYDILGDMYKWVFNVVNYGQSKYVYLNITANGSYSPSEIYYLGVDPR